MPLLKIASADFNANAQRDYGGYNSLDAFVDKEKLLFLV
jgi:hypothetical protein